MLTADKTNKLVKSKLFKKNDNANDDDYDANDDDTDDDIRR